MRTCSETLPPTTNPFSATGACRSFSTLHGVETTQTFLSSATKAQNDGNCFANCLSAIKQCGIICLFLIWSGDNRRLALSSWVRRPPGTLAPGYLIPCSILSKPCLVPILGFWECSSSFQPSIYIYISTIYTYSYLCTCQCHNWNILVQIVSYTEASFFRGLNN